MNITGCSSRSRSCDKLMQRQEKLEVK